MYWEWSLACTNLKLCIRIFLEDCQLAWEKIVLGYMLAMQKYKLSHLPVLRNIPWHFKLNNIDKIHKHTHTSLVTFASANAKWKKKMQKCKNAKTRLRFSHLKTPTALSFRQIPCNWKIQSVFSALIDFLQPLSFSCLSLVAQGANHFAGDSQYGPVDVEEMVLSYASWEAGLTWSNFLHRLSLVLLYWAEGV